MLLQQAYMSLHLNFAKGRRAGTSGKVSIFDFEAVLGWIGACGELFMGTYPALATRAYLTFMAQWDSFLFFSFFYRQNQSITQSLWPADIP